MSSSNDNNMLGIEKGFDKRSVAHKRREQARMKAADVMLDMLKMAFKAGHRAKYVLFDSLFSENEIIRIYGKRLDIEAFFKTCKSMLKLETGGRSLSYDAMAAYVSVVFTRYMLIFVEKRIDEDDRNAGELFYLMCAELQNITFSRSMSITVQAFLDSVMGSLRLTDEQITGLLNRFYS